MERNAYQKPVRAQNPARRVLEEGSSAAGDAVVRIPVHAERALSLLSASRAATR
jgi:hypothetical protein